jgi:hypothetical protein
MAKPSIKTRCVANVYATEQQRIAEFMAVGPEKHGGGLFSVRVDGFGEIIAELYRLDDTVKVRVDPARLDLAAEDWTKLADRMTAKSPLQRIREELAAYDAKIDDDANGGENARPPTGDDYNEVLAIAYRDWKPDPVRDAAADLLAAARSLIDAYGGDWPDWLGNELAALETAVFKAEGRANG